MTDQRPDGIAVHDIVQIDPAHKWGGCLVVVTEVKSWGVQGFVGVPQKGLAYIRLTHGTFESTGGRAVWVDRDQEADEGADT